MQEFNEKFLPNNVSNINSENKDVSFETPRDAYARIRNKLLSLVDNLFNATSNSDPNQEVDGFIKLVQELKFHIDNHSLEYLKNHPQTRNQIQGAVWAIEEVGQKVIDRLGSINLPSNQFSLLTTKIIDEVNDVKSREKLSY